jgi:exopolyphosphatase / guanosine-5'-triphosphate,3'-diphosphate pyrophosphatase
MPRAADAEEIIAAIDVGTNAVRLELAKVLSEDTFETLHSERDPVRPGEGLFATGVLQKAVVDRLVATLRRYAALCRRYKSRVRAVATSALREAKNRDEVVKRVKKESGLTLEVISGREEARLICLGVLHGKPETQKSLNIDIGGGSTEIILAMGQRPVELKSLDMGAVRLSELFKLKDTVAKKQLDVMRDFVDELIEKALPKGLANAPVSALGSSGTIGAVVDFARSEGMGHATSDELQWAVEELALMSLERRRKRFDVRRADIILAGAVILERVVRYLKIKSVTPVNRGLREGVLYDLLQKRKPDSDDHSLLDAALSFGRRLAFGEAHAKQVARLSLRLFDGLAPVHKLPASVRPWLEVAALLHDVGHVVSHNRHHKHSQYLILNAELPGLSERERQLVAAMARFHRRSQPTVEHEALQGFSLTEIRLVRKCSALLRVADSLDRSHRQPVTDVAIQFSGAKISLKLKSKQSVDLEVWDVGHDAEFFKMVFEKTLIAS